MDPRRYIMSRYMAATGMGLLTLAFVLFFIKLLLSVAYPVAAGMAAAGLVLMVVGAIYRRL